MREELVKWILERLEGDAEAISREFASERKIKTRYAVIDGLLPEETAKSSRLHSLHSKRCG
jgi:hypothetical protein